MTCPVLEGVTARKIMATSLSTRHRHTPHTSYHKVLSVASRDQQKFLSSVSVSRLTNSKYIFSM